jgi:hypothetical protein
MDIGRVLTVVGAAAAGAVLAGTVMTYAQADEDDDGAPAVHDHSAAAGEGEGDEATGEGEGGGHGKHEHPELAPYGERFDDASGDEQEAADELLADVTTTLEAYADVDDAVAAGYRAPRDPKGRRWHYLNPELVRDDNQLDPDEPEGLVYYTVEGHDPVLIGAFFVTPKGAEAPTPAGDLVVWHSHDPACAGFFATADEPCTTTRRMLHVWTADTITMVGRRQEREVEVRVVDPFGAPLEASVERVDGD